MTKVNHEIKANTVKVVDSETKGVNEMSLADAIALAEETNEDVIMLSCSNGIPIVKIEDYSKYMYREQKKKKEQAKKQRANNMSFKEIRMLYSIDKHDMNIKAKNVDRLINEGNKVKVSLIYKGRSIKNIRSGLEVMQNFKDILQSNCKIDGGIKIEGNRVIMTIIPNK